MSKELKTIETLTAADALALTRALGSSRQRIARTQAAAPAPRARCRRTKEIVVEISQDDQKAYRAKCPRENIFTEAQTWEALRANIRNAIRSCSFEDYRPGRIQIHLVRDETLVLR